jgi:hypothetical protein
MYVFSIDIPFKGSQSLAKMTSKVTAESYLHNRVNESAKFFQNLHICTVVSMTPLCTSQRSQWLRCARHSSVNDSAVHVTAESMWHALQSQMVVNLFFKFMDSWDVGGLLMICFDRCFGTATGAVFYSHLMGAQIRIRIQNADPDQGSLKRDKCRQKALID